MSKDGGDSAERKMIKSIRRDARRVNAIKGSEDDMRAMEGKSH